MFRQTLAAYVAAAIALAGCETQIPYSGRVIDARGRPVPKATVVGSWHAKPPSPEMVYIGGPVDNDGRFSLSTSTKLQEITAISPDKKRHVTIENPAPTGNVIVLQ